jgi:signal transduction histidine kinase
MAARIPPQLVPAIVLQTLAACLLSITLPTWDKELAYRLLAACGASPLAPGSNANWLSAAGAANLFGIVLLAAAATGAAWRLAAVPRMIVTVSLLAAAALYQMEIAQLTGAAPHTLAFLTALVAGFAGGVYLRQIDDRQHHDQAHYYELKLKNKELLETRLTLLKQDEIERRTLAADLHDQVLNDLKQIAQRFEKHCQQSDEENTQAIRNLLDQVMSEIREVMDSLSPSVLEHLGLPAALEDCLRRGAQRAGFKMRFKNGTDQEALARLSMVEQGLLYRLAQESITNICKHAGASLVRLQISGKENEILTIRITDDGKGMTTEQTKADSRGLKYMRYRADLINAKINWQPGDSGKGTTVEIQLDLSEREVNKQDAQVAGS